MSSLLDRISELEQQIATLKVEVEKEEKEKDPNKRWRAEEGNIYWFIESNGTPSWLYECNKDRDNERAESYILFIRGNCKTGNR